MPKVTPQPKYSIAFYSKRYGELRGEKMKKEYPTLPIAEIRSMLQTEMEDVLRSHEISHQTAATKPKPAIAMRRRMKSWTMSRSIHGNIPR